MKTYLSQNILELTNKIQDMNDFPLSLAAWHKMCVWIEMNTQWAEVEDENFNTYMSEKILCNDIQATFIEHLLPNLFILIAYLNFWMSECRAEKNS